MNNHFTNIYKHKKKKETFYSYFIYYKWLLIIMKYGFS